MRNVASSLASGRRPPARIGIAPGLFYGVTALLLAINAGLVLMLTMHEDIARLVTPAADARIGLYETRIADLRTEIDRLNSRQYAREGDINLQLHDLVQQQEDLTEQQQIVRALATMAEDLGLVAADTPAPAAARSVFEAAGKDTAALSLGSIGTALDVMRAENQATMSALADRARTASDTISQTLQSVGIAAAAPAVGGPFEPAKVGSSSALTETANAVAEQLRRFAAFRDAAADAPVHRPLVGTMRISSVFGNRTDPFTGGKAFHSGTDYAAPTGTKVLATGAGRVVFAGNRSGYGKLVEIDHGGGIISRYGHMSAILVSVGDDVSTGDIIGKVGSTGRSTGPHLHFEIRRSGAPVDPTAFLRAGRTLKALL